MDRDRVRVRLRGCLVRDRVRARDRGRVRVTPRGCPAAARPPRRASACPGRSWRRRWPSPTW
eukprot:scaffold79463_cov27-Phaeocystis_antarctica.AAC.1